MPKRKQKKPAPQVLISDSESKPPKSEIETMQEFVEEAQLVDRMTTHPGYLIIKRDVEMTRQQIGMRLAYLNPKSDIYYEAVINFLACDKLLKMVEDYDTNKKRTLELLEKIDNPQENIILDVDN